MVSTTSSIEGSIEVKFYRQHKTQKSVGQGIPESFKAAHMLVKALMLYVANIIPNFLEKKKSFIKQGCIILIKSHSKRHV